jgi:hypothetical protein
LRFIAQLAARDRGSAFRSLREDIDTSSPAGRLVLQMFAFADWPRISRSALQVTVHNLALNRTARQSACGEMRVIRGAVHCRRFRDLPVRSPSNVSMPKGAPAARADDWRARARAGWQTFAVASSGDPIARCRPQPRLLGLVGAWNEADIIINSLQINRILRTLAQRLTVHEPLEADGDKYKPLESARLLSQVLPDK